MSAVQGIATGVWVGWSIVVSVGLFGDLYCKLRPSDKVELLWRAAARVHQEVWLFVPPGILLGTIHDWHSPKPWMIAFDAFALWNWWNLRNWPEDNHWKRRGKKAKDAVAVRLGRLVVVPAGAGS